jgi:hypothetical protein
MKPYFSHDEGARNDPKLVEVMMQLGHEGKSVYWDLVEMLYEQGGYLMLAQCKGYAFALRTNCDLILSLVNDFGLFATDGVKFWSETALRRLEQRNAKSAKAKESAAKRWSASERNANALPPQSEGNAIKVKEIKGKETTSVDVAGEQTGSGSSSVDLPALTAEKKGAAAGPREFYYDEAPVFQMNAFFAYLDSIGYKHVDKGHYLVQIQAVGREKMIHTTDEKWRSFIRTWLNNDKRDGKLMLPQPITTTGNLAVGRNAIIPAAALGDLNARIQAQQSQEFIL